MQDPNPPRLDRGDDLLADLESLRQDFAAALPRPARIVVAREHTRRSRPGMWSEAFAYVIAESQPPEERVRALLRIVDLLDTRAVWPGNPPAKKALKQEAGREGVSATRLLRDRYLPDAVFDALWHIFRADRLRLGSRYLRVRHGDGTVRILDNYVPGDMLVAPVTDHPGTVALWYYFLRWWTKTVRNAVELRVSVDGVVPEPDLEDDALQPDRTISLDAPVVGGMDATLHSAIADPATVMAPGCLQGSEFGIWAEQVHALAGLSEAEDEVWRLRLQSYKIAEIADRTDRAEGTVKSLLHRAHTKLRKAAS